MEWLSRTEKLIGKDALDRLASSRVAVFGAGGVGSFVIEGLVRSGIGAIDVVDNDKVSLSNLNRQLIATLDTVGMDKTAVVRDRIKSINPDCKVTEHKMFFLPETADEFDFSVYDYVVDAIDTVAGKLAIIEKCSSLGIPVISSMGTGNKLDPSEFRIADIYDTKVCPLAKAIRKECRKRGIESLKVLYSEEDVLKPETDPGNDEVLPPGKKTTPGSISFVPSVAGLMIAGEVIKDLIGRK
ncbi:MAG: tRNA threonylcarbamoyladenosine dehydratase [Firmicutes bacterium]|nr:tRNA threonylcarbamoyladenosine dehydratase [Bacillota bacterium]